MRKSEKADMEPPTVIFKAVTCYGYYGEVGEKA